jgi:hypothetical protein
MHLLDQLQALTDTPQSSAVAWLQPLTRSISAANVIYSTASSMTDPISVVSLSAAETPQGRLLIAQSGTTPMMLKLKGGLWPRAKRRSSVGLAPSTFIDEMTFEFAEPLVNAPVLPTLLPVTESQQN